ncbi:MAG: hypothetical protein R3D66_05490 [Alphaproteobacteria bacterium]
MLGGGGRHDLSDFADDAAASSIRGNAILANQKAIRSSQVVADLITRARSVNSTDIDEAVEAGRLAFEPLTQQLRCRYYQYAL